MIESTWGRLLLATVLGALIGWERFIDRKSAGLRTHTLVCLGATAFVVAGERYLQGHGYAGVDPTRIVQGVITGIGFLGAGTIIQSGGSVHGLTTAATIWLTAAIGMAAGTGDAWLAVFLTGLGLLVLRGFRWIERAWLRAHPHVHSQPRLHPRDPDIPPGSS
jgi:putative Mg2+ transporter-C (MgtC) family protein